MVFHPRTTGTGIASINMCQRGFVIFVNHAAKVFACSKFLHGASFCMEQVFACSKEQLICTRTGFVASIFYWPFLFFSPWKVEAMSPTGFVFRPVLSSNSFKSWSKKPLQINNTKGIKTAASCNTSNEIQVIIIPEQTTHHNATEILPLEKMSEKTWVCMHLCNLGNSKNTVA